jgi:hypothetical protein
MYKYVIETTMLAGASERPAFGVETFASFSKSPKKAVECSGQSHYRLVGEEATPIVEKRQLWLGSRLIWEKWD